VKDGWKSKTLGEVCEVVNGGTPKTSVADYWGGGHLWITPAEMGKRSSPYVNETDRKLTDLGLRDSSARLLPALSVILSSRAPIGHLVINTEPMATNQGCKGLVPRKLIDHKFVFYYLGSIVDLLNDLGTGATFKELSGGKLKEVSLPVPSLSDQKRIVAILDEVFQGISAAVANAEKNLASARELFDTYLNAVFTQKGKGWLEKPLSEIGGDVYTGPFGSLLHKSDYILGGVPLVNPAHIIDGKIVPDEEKTVDASAMARLQNYRLSRGDVVIGRRGEIGRCAVVTAVEEGWLCGTGCFYIRVFKRTNPFFLAHLLRSKPYRENLEALSSGATMLNLSNTSLSELPICLPNLEEQDSIVAKAEALSSQIEILESLYRQKLADLAELKQAILQKAFAGELTAQPEKALQEAVAA
jgi:type I restriction enzyme, S subunit